MQPETRTDVTFEVCNREEGFKQGVLKSFFFTNKDNEYKVGEKFIHHYHGIECIVTKLDTITLD